MKTKLLTLVFAFLVISFCSPAQEYAFKVLANKGTNQVKVDNAWKPIKTGATLQSDGEIKLSDNAYVGLIHKNGKPMELKQAGTYKISELSRKVGEGTSLINKYTSFILTSNSAEAKKNRLSATGAVHRATDAATIRLLLPEDQFVSVYNSQVFIKWEAGKVKAPFQVTVRNVFNDELAKIETSMQSVVLNLDEAKYASENSILVEVSDRTNSVVSKQYPIKKISPVEREKISNSLREIMSSMQEQTAINKIILAGFYEQNNLFIDAMAAYDAAGKMAPDVQAYSEAYEDFVGRLMQRNAGE